MADIAICKIDNIKYPDKNELFRPSEHYPEYEFEELSEEKNFVYDAVRTALLLYGFDAERFGLEEWNPLQEIVKEDTTVLIKPNLDRLGTNRSLSTKCPNVLAPLLSYFSASIASPTPKESSTNKKILLNFIYHHL